MTEKEWDLDTVEKAEGTIDIDIDTGISDEESLARYRLFAFLTTLWATPLKQPDRKEPEQITELARQIVTNVVFFARGAYETEMAFGIMLAFGHWDEWDVDSIGGFYEHYDKAGPRGVNGYPSFMSMRLLHRDDLPALQDEVERMARALGLIPEEADHAGG